MEAKIRREALVCEHVENSGYKIPQLRLHTPLGSKYVCRDCYAAATAGPPNTRPRKDFVRTLRPDIRKIVAIVDLTP